MPHEAQILGLKDYEIKDIRREGRRVMIQARYTGPVSCPHCAGVNLRKKDRFTRKLRHETWGVRHCHLHLEAYKFHCLSCDRYFNQRFPAIQPRRRSTEAFRRQVFQLHYDGVNQKRLAKRQRIGTATIERWFHDFLKLEVAKMSAEPCPEMLGIDEHFFSKKQGFATTFCDLKNHKVYDVTLGRSEAALDGYFRRLKGKENVKLVCIDLASNYRALIRKHFPNAKIVADRFHVIRLVNQHFMSVWRELDPKASRNRGLRSLMRRHEQNLSPDKRERLQAYLAQHPALAAIYAFKQELCRLLSIKHRTKRQCKRLIPRLLRYIDELKQSGLEPMVTLGRTLGSWAEEVAAMWRFTKNNGITEGFHNKMEEISRRAYGFRKFANYRLRVRVMCS